MRPNLFSEEGFFYRGNLHSHSTRSDGMLEPEQLCDAYKKNGYDFICLSDHLVGIYGYPITDTSEFRDNHFTTLMGAEVHSGAMGNGELWHLLAVGLPTNFKPPEAPNFKPIDGMESAASVAQRCRDAGAFVAIAHPQWSGLTLNDARSITAAHAVEIYNHGCYVGAGRGDGFSILDLLLTDGKKINLIATDDSHFTEPDHFGGWVMVKAKRNNPDTLLTALKAGHFYSTQGPTFQDIELFDNEIIIKCSPCTTIILAGKGSAAEARHGQSMTRASIKLDRFYKHDWLRVTIVDAAGQRAWSNPIWRC
ncbi:MAG: phosphotransferase [Pseudomonadota bacterium]|nr:phosphotransferase [Pseudomonadota bacterium]